MRIYVYVFVGMCVKPFVCHHLEEKERYRLQAETAVRRGATYRPKASQRVSDGMSAGSRFRGFSSWFPLKPQQPRGILKIITDPNGALPMAWGLEFHG